MIIQQQHSCCRIIISTILFIRYQYQLQLYHTHTHTHYYQSRHNLIYAYRDKILSIKRIHSVKTSLLCLFTRGVNFLSFECGSVRITLSQISRMIDNNWTDLFSCFMIQMRANRLHKQTMFYELKVSFDFCETNIHLLFDRIWFHCLSFSSISKF